MTAVDAVPMVFVHGTRFSAGQWSTQLAALRDEFPVAAVDLPGHGERSAQSWSLTAATEIIASAVDSLDRGPALVVGHSLGGYASLEFARHRPERLRGWSSREPVPPPGASGQHRTGGSPGRCPVFPRTG